MLATHARLLSGGPLVVYGSVDVMRAAAASLGIDAHVVAVAGVAEAGVVRGAIPVIDCAEGLALRSLAPYPWGAAVPAFGALQHAALVRAIEDARAGAIAGIVTAPWHKKRLADAGLPPTGHTEVLAERAGVDEVVMLLAGDVLRVALATTHVPLREVAGLLTTEKLVRIGQIVASGLRTGFGLSAPRLAFCGLNPHAGEEGVLGHEDAAILAPAVARLRELGVDATGPHAADTLFAQVVAGYTRADAVVAMYHDQGLAPLKAVHFGRAANITLGLPFVRTSVDHGTAYDVAGTSAVRTDAFEYAVGVARDMVARRG